MTAAIVLKITLDDVVPQVLRRVVVPINIRLDRLHLVIQAAMGWTNSHLWEIRVRDIGWGIPDPDWYGGPLDAAKARLIDVVQDTGAKTFKYIYDFGDGWEHTIKLERSRPIVPGTAELYPFLLEAVGARPMEDCGGPWVYAELLAAKNDINHERHMEALESIPDDFDPTAVDVRDLERRVDLLAKKWARKPAAKKPRLS
jgi:hypothetical protein